MKVKIADYRDAVDTLEFICQDLKQMKQHEFLESKAIRRLTPTCQIVMEMHSVVSNERFKKDRLRAKNWLHVASELMTKYRKDKMAAAFDEAFGHKGRILKTEGNVTFVNFRR